MVSIHSDSPWKIMVGVAFLLLFACVGIAHVVSPDWFIERSGVRKGGEMLTEWNRLSFRAVGAIFTGVAVYILYSLSRDYFAK